MSVNLSVKNVPDELAQRLRERADRNHRSLQRELMAILEHVVAESTSESVRRTVNEATGTTTRRPIEDVLAELRTIFPRARDRGDSAAKLVREMRDSRYGEPRAKRPRRAAA